jgi:2-polyprenyl-6-methoxyphenol hydroxylase-like FAD-dependent oxidoreductase
LIRDGAKPFDYGQSQLHVHGTWLPRVKTALVALAQTRPFLEHRLRRWISEIPNVEVIYQASVSAPVLDSSGARVTGVEVYLRGESRRQTVPADLVVDATGRSTGLLRWLSEKGFGSVPEVRIGINLGYATGRFRVPERLLPDSPLLYLVGPPPRAAKVGVVFQVEDGIVFGGMGGYHGDHPPADLDGFLNFAKGLSQPHIFDVLSRAELRSPIERFMIPASIRRHYRQMRGFPSGLLPIGDAICRLDPAFGQGMSIAAFEAGVLARCLQGRRNDFGRQFQQEYFRGVNAVLDVAWDLSSRENLKYPQTTRPRPWTFPLASRYMQFLVTAGDPCVMAELYKVISLTADPAIALRPSLAVRALLRAARLTSS